MTQNPDLIEPAWNDTPELADWYLGQVVQAVIDSDDYDLAVLLLSAKLAWKFYEEWNESTRITVTLSAPHRTITALKQPAEKYTEERRVIEKWTYERDPLTLLNKVEHFLTDLLPTRIAIATFETKILPVSIPSDWRTELPEAMRLRAASNQGSDFGKAGSPPLRYGNLNFRSQSEIKIAQALDRKGVMYFANCTARINKGGDRVNREPDFLICATGRWGILEVDGAPYHPPTRTVDDHDRDRLFANYSIRVIQHYDANRCYQEPDQVVTEFLGLLAKNG